MARRLTKKEKGFVKDIVSGKNGTQAALANYDTNDENTAANIASTNLRKPKIVNAIEAMLPDELLAKKHLEGLFATRGIYRQNDEYSWQKIDEEPDYPTIHKYLDTAYKIKGKYKDINVGQALIVQLSDVASSKYGLIPSTKPDIERSA